MLTIKTIFSWFLAEEISVSSQHVKISLLSKDFRENVQKLLSNKSILVRGD